MKVFLIIICFVFAGGQLAAQQLTLDTAIAIALKNSPGLMISKNNMNIEEDVSRKKVKSSGSAGQN